MAFSWDTTDLETSKALKADHLNSGADALSGFINEGIAAVELKNKRPATGVYAGDPYVNKGWVDSKIIYRPEFYGSPSPRMVAQSGQTHWRETSNDWAKGASFNNALSGTSFVGVPGACTKIKLRHDAHVNIMCSFYMFEFGGVDKSLKTSEDEFSQGFTKTPTNGGYETNAAGDSYIQVNGNPYGSTKRSIYTSFVDPRRGYIDFSGNDSDTEDWWQELAPYRYVSRGFILLPMIGRHQHHVTAQVHLNAGIHDIGLVFKPRVLSGITRWINPYQHNSSEFRENFKFQRNSGSPEYPREKHIFFLARNLVVDSYYTSNTPK